MSCGKWWLLLKTAAPYQDISSAIRYLTTPHQDDDVGPPILAAFILALFSVNFCYYDQVLLF
jgi:hypothetical protein